MLITHAAHGTWSPWLVPGDVIVPFPGLLVKWHHGIIVAIDTHRARFLMACPVGKRVVWCADHVLDRMPQRDEVGIRRTDAMPTRGLNGLRLASAPARART